MRRGREKKKKKKRQTSGLGEGHTEWSIFQDLSPNNALYDHLQKRQRMGIKNSPDTQRSENKNRF